MIGTRRYAPCQCRCGQEATVLVANLRSGKSKSCGCWKRERTATIVAETRWKDSHGRAAGDKDDLYRMWLRIKQRCYNPNADNYRWYGGASPPVKMAAEWVDDAGVFISYVERELGPRPSPKHSIDRELGADYAPGKIRWATPLEQARNRKPRTARRGPEQ